MAFFFLTSLGGAAPTVDTAVTEKLSLGSVFQIEPGKWMIKTDAATSQSVSQTLGLADSVTHIVTLVGGYYGRAAPALWEWMAATKPTTK